jgi:hypothetical protein
MIGKEKEMYSYRALKMYSKARRRGRRGQIWSLLTRRSRRLFNLDEINDACTVRPRRQPGIQTVSIDQIRGSEGRTRDFDCDFNPLQNHNQARWVRVASARQEGKSLPPVELIQVGDVYFVRDGHHRISVARALGQPDIEAEVMVWEVTKPLPWEQTATPRKLAWQAA